MDKTQYFDLMRETSDFVYPLIEARIDALRDEEGELHSIVRHIVEKRDTRLLLRPLLIRLTYELCGGKDWRITAPIGAAFELLNISSYQANSAFDGKYNILSTPQRNSQFIASMVTREMAAEVMATARADFSDKVVDALLNDLSTCNKNIYLAQHYDMNLLVASNYEHYSDEDVFLSAYTKRCFLGCGIFTGLCAQAGGRLVNADVDILSALNRFGEEFGIALQIVNDLADFVPSGSGSAVVRGHQDQLSDLRNGRMTLGCYKLFGHCGVHGERVLKRLRNGESILETESTNIISQMVKRGIVNDILKVSLKHELAANNELSIFLDSQAKEVLFQMLTICHINKFTKALNMKVGA